jgi:CheY-like chemotaxis protein
VTDLGLPGIDGYELCRRLNRDDRLSRIPIVAITGRYFSPADIARAHREGCHAVLIKPFVGEALIAEVRRALDR